MFLLPLGFVAHEDLCGLQVHVLDRVQSGTKPELVRALGATYYSGSVTGIGFEPHVIIECTGVGPVINDCIQQVGSWGLSASLVSELVARLATASPPTWQLTPS